MQLIVFLNEKRLCTSTVNFLLVAVLKPIEYRIINIIFHLNILGKILGKKFVKNGFIMYSFPLFFTKNKEPQTCYFQRFVAQISINADTTKKS
ncbi:hypothetical protein SAMN05216249_10482 [Acetitomaculum ruminis DSM 5522]|uniref:Uncharacterized protein n=1 Tax=Acetitomaculum ruminis DSM 5522 TaxID=1120918 RepID=A0A1I0WJJ0_9FIRM|nr:hypothetical protein SAMN05216249_10482 [Acetitomaculum ruminis DSM 5522]